MTYIFDEWEKKLNAFKESVTKELHEIRAAKAEVQLMKTEIMNAVAEGYYRRDDKRIILSAPEIIIGDVDKDGHLWMNGEHSKVIIRSNDISIEGVASSVNAQNVPDPGTITCRASSIKNMAVDPGPTGTDDVVFPTKSEIVTLGQAVKVSTIDTDWVVPELNKTAPKGVTIHSCDQLTIDSSVSCEKLQASLTTKQGVVNADLATKQAQLQPLYEEAKKGISDLKKLHQDAEKLLGNSVEDVRTNSMDLLYCHNEIEKALPAVYNSVKALTDLLDVIARESWDSKQLGTIVDQLTKKKEKFNDVPTGASMNVNSEKISVNTKDGDDNIRVNKEAGIKCNTNKVDITALDKKGQLLSKSSFDVRAMNMDLSTANRTTDKDKKVVVEPNGKIRLQTRELEVNSYNLEEQEREGADPIVTETELPVDSIMNVMMNTTLLSSLDEKGNTVGVIGLNAKNVVIVSDSKNMESGESKKQEPDTGVIALMAQKLILGTENVNNKTTETIVTTEKLTVSAETSAEVNEGKGKAVVKMEDKNIDMTAEMLTAKSKLTVEKAATFKDSVTGDKDATFNEVTGEKLLKGPTVNDASKV